MTRKKGQTNKDSDRSRRIKATQDEHRVHSIYNRYLFTAYTYNDLLDIFILAGIEMESRDTILIK